MWLILDIGNTAVKGGLFENGVLKHTFRIRSQAKASVPAYRHALRHHIGDVTIERIGLISVVPVLTEKLSQALRQEMMVLPEILHTGLDSPLVMKYKTPDTLGVDRFAAAVAAYAQYGRDEDGTNRSLLVLSGGTAMTYEVVTARGEYLGGAIGVGPTLALRALKRGTAQLPDINLTPPRYMRTPPRYPIGRTSAQAVRSGILFGFIDGVTGMMERLKRQLRAEPVVVATGGWGEFLHQHIPGIHHLEPALVLYGGYELLSNS